MTVYPGLIDSESYLGLTEISAEGSTNDLIETSDEIMPHMHVYDAFHAESELIPVARLNGITNAIVAPAEPGHAARPGFVYSTRRQVGQRHAAGARHRHAPELYRRAAAQRVLGEAKVSPDPHGTGGATAPGLPRCAGLSQRWAEYEKKKSDAIRRQRKKGPPSPPKHDLKLEALLPYLQGKKPIVLAAQEPSDLETAVGLARQFNLKFVLNHISHSQSVLDYVASLKVPVIVGPIYEDPKNYERYDAVYRLPGELYKRGVKIAFASYDAHAVRNLPYAAGFATAFGLPYDEALKAITLNPAEIWGVADQLGSLDVGKTANVVVANGDPLDVKTDVKQSFHRWPGSTDEEPPDGAARPIFPVAGVVRHSCVGQKVWCGSDTPFDFAQGRLCPTLLTWVLKYPKLIWTLGKQQKIQRPSQRRRTEPALSEVEGSVRPTLATALTPWAGASRIPCGRSGG